MEDHGATHKSQRSVKRDVRHGRSRRRKLSKDTAEEQSLAVHQKRRLPARARVQARVDH